MNSCEVYIETKNKKLISCAEIFDVKVLEYDVFEICEENDNADVAKADLRVKTEITAGQEYLDEEHSYYDKEEQNFFLKRQLRKNMIILWRWR